MEYSLVEGLKDRIETASGSYQSVGIVLPSNNYNELTHALFDFIRSKPDTAFIYVTINKPYHLLYKEFKDTILESSITFIDCVSRASGIQTTEDHCYFLDSTSQLEQLILLIVNVVKKIGNDQQVTVILDTLSTLNLYNDNDGLFVNEFYSHLLNNLYLYNTHMISLCLKEEMNDYMNKLLYLKNEKIIKLKESFI
jgi:hypothetical protein